MSITKTERAFIRRWRIAAMAALLILVASAPLWPQSAITFRYFYDELGQLVSAVDSTGVVLQWVYDFVGNILEVKRTTLTTPDSLAIFSFTPARGAPSTIVTIQGQGFSTTPGANTVMFNGVPAIVLSASATTLVVLVPSGATAGAISVMVGGVTVTSGTLVFSPSTIPPIETVLTGRVVDLSGTPVSGALAISPDGRSAASVSDGRFSISGVAATLPSIVVQATATVAGVALAGVSAAVAPRAGDVTDVGTIAVASCAPPYAGLVSWWPADSNVFDIVGGNHGVSRPIIGTSGETTGVRDPGFATGRVGQAFSFNGVDQFLEVAIPSLASITSEITVAGWMNPQATTSGFGTVFRTRGLRESFTVRIDVLDGRVKLFVGDSIGDLVASSAPGAIKFGLWQHIAATANTTTGRLRIFVNGQEVAVDAPRLLTGQIAAATTLLIGRFDSEVAWSYKGLIDELQLSSLELTQAQIQAIASAPPGGVCRASYETTVGGRLLDGGRNPLPGATARTVGDASAVASPGGDFLIPGVLTTLGPVTVDGSAIVAARPLFGRSASLEAVRGGRTDVGEVILSACSPNGLVSLWPGEGTANDIVGGNHGTFSGAGFLPGLAGGQAFSFNGVNAFIDVPSSATLGAITPAITVAGWINPQPTISGRGTVFARRSPGVGESFTIRIDGFGRIALFVGDTSGVVVFSSAPGVIQFDQWQHIAAMANAATGLVTAFVNGKQVALTSPRLLSGQLAPASNLFIGRFDGEIGWFYKGLIDELQLYGLELNHAQIKNLFAMRDSGMCRP
jgi:YD repeat-containing protein